MAESTRDYTEAILVPVAHAAWFGAFGYLPLVITGYLAHWQHPWQYAALIDSLIAWLAFAAYTEKWYRYFMLLAGPVMPSIREPVPQLFEARVTWNEGHAGAWAELDVPADWFYRWCRGVARGNSLAEERWCGGPNNPSKREYKAMLETMRARGWARWINERAHAQGQKLTDLGEEMIIQWAKEIATPLPRS